MAIKVGYLLMGDPLDKTYWSGTTYSIFQELKKNFDVLVFRPSTRNILEFFLRFRNQIFLKILGQRIDWRHSNVLTRIYKNRIIEKFKFDELDFLIVPGNLMLVDALETQTPIVFIGDRALAGSMDYHKQLSGLSPRSKEESLNMEYRAFEKCERVIFPSDWATSNARQFYPMFAHKFLTIPFGINFSEELRFEVEVKKTPKNDGKLKLLFVGVNWQEKGGQTAIDCLLTLRSHGIQATLTVVGCIVPEQWSSLDYVTVVGYLNKNLKTDLEKLIVLYKSHDIFILPTRFEAFGIAFCEAAYFGLPSLGPDTGGVSSALIDKVTGVLMNKNAMGEDYANEIKKLIKYPDIYQKLSESSMRYARTHFSWQSWLNSMKSELDIRAK